MIFIILVDAVFLLILGLVIIVLHMLEKVWCFLTYLNRQKIERKSK